MNIYIYHPVTKEYLKTELAVIDPLETEIQETSIYAIPMNATEIAPPTHVAGTASIFTNGAWAQVADNRGDIYYMPAIEAPVTITQIGEVEHANAQTEKDVEFRRADAWEETKKHRIALINEDLAYTTIAGQSEIYQLDEQAVISFSDALDMIDLDPTRVDVQWTTATNTSVTLTVDDIKEINMKRIVRKENVHIASQLLRTDIDAHATPETLDILTELQTKIAAL